MIGFKIAQCVDRRLGAPARRSSIICTIKPETNSVEAINKLRAAGLDFVRMNFSYGAYEYHSM